MRGIDDPPTNIYVGKLSAELARLKELCSHDTISLHTLILSMTSRSHAVLTLFFALPFLLPIPLPGLSVLFGMIIFMAGIAMALNKKPWLPKRLLSKEVSSSVFEKVFERGIKISQRLEKVVRPRGSFLMRHPGMRPMSGFIIAVCGLLLALPLPPGTNFPPATAILLLSIGSLEEDALFMILGYIAFAINIAFFALITVFGINGIKMLLPA